MPHKNGLVDAESFSNLQIQTDAVSYTSNQFDH